MAKLAQCMLGALISLLAAAPAAATDFSTGGIHQGDYKWMGINFMRSQDAKLPYGVQNDTYMELEFGGRSGIFDLYGYVDMFNLLDSRTDQRHNGDNVFIKFQPRLSLDALFNKDLSFGPVKELYISSIFNVGDNEAASQGKTSSLKQYYIGPGSDVMVPWLGKVGVNLMARYLIQNYGASNEGKFDGYMLDTNWFKPFVKFKNGTYIAYQGYYDQQFGAYKAVDAGNTSLSKNSTEIFNGFYWHSKSINIGYGLKYFKNMGLVRNNVPDGVSSTGGMQSTTGLGSYFDVTYNF